MKKPKITIQTLSYGPAGYGVDVVFEFDKNVLFTSKKAAREWAKEWCRTAGEALMKAGGCDFVMGLRKGQKAEKGK